MFRDDIEAGERLCPGKLVPFLRNPHSDVGVENLDAIGVENAYRHHNIAGLIKLRAARFAARD